MIHFNGEPLHDSVNHGFKIFTTLPLKKIAFQHLQDGETDDAATTTTITTTESIRR